MIDREPPVDASVQNALALGATVENTIAALVRRFREVEAALEEERERCREAERERDALKVRLRLEQARCDMWHAEVARLEQEAPAEAPAPPEAQE